MDDVGCFTDHSSADAAAADDAAAATDDDGAIHHATTQGDAGPGAEAVFTNIILRE
jgi:hypothetical protein